ncbi:ankyrin repeat protein, putative [Trichomonas vaginalis G3]|uniref:Ankyrin repeat protein, putative n=1 Tax=Trichomonas vaginalis (strain ATCC PRA-98 / G3) TaxID=412133 RepID=A2G610_TRIV3|nr:ankyrin repeat protein, putative [Trichomonas vaginalis G3]|eukprot:XP_001300336.1 ankyrin repeat protein [Trichomonas vaginalis G3]
MTSLFDYAAKDDVFNLKKLINSGADINRTNENNETALHFAVVKGNVKATRLLISCGANLNIQTAVFGETPLHLAVQQNNRELINLLLDAGADPNVKNCDDEGPIFTAIRWGNPDIISLLADRGCILNDVNKFGQTPYGVATHFQSRKSTSALVSCGVTPQISGVPSILSLDKMNKPLVGGSEKKKVFGFRQSPPGISDLFEVVSTNQVQVLQDQLKKGIKINEVANFNKETLLHSAVLYGSTDCVEVLIQNGALVNEKTEFGLESPLQIAIREGFFDIFFLLIRNGADIESENCDGETPIFQAVKANRIEMFRVLVRRGADVNHQNVSGFTPINFAVLASNKFMVEALLFYGATFPQGQFNPYMFAFKAGDDEIANIIQCESPNLAEETRLPPNLFQIIKANNMDELQALITKGFRLDLVDSLEGSPLHCACRADAIDCVKLLIESGADVNIIDIQNRETPFMTAINSQSEQSIRELLQNADADLVNVRNKEGETSLFYAVRKNNYNLVMDLVTKGAEINTYNNNGVTPLYVATGLKYTDIARYLMDNGADITCEIHQSIKLAQDMNERELVDVLSSKPVTRDNSRTARSDLRKSRLGSRCTTASTQGRQSSLTMRSGNTTLNNSSTLANALANTYGTITLGRDEEKTFQLPENFQEGLCVVCQRNKATQKLIPCNHVCTCHGCIKQFIEMQIPCPFCGLKFYATKPAGE